MDKQFLKAQNIMVEVLPTHPLIKLMNALNWEELGLIILPDLKQSTSKLKWWLGRKLKIRTHLGVFLLQQLLNETDRGIERQLRDNAVYAVFCGKTFVQNWNIPDHTKIEAFRSRLSPETQCQLANIIAKQAQKKGFAKASDIDIDSTVQTPDMQPPATVNLLVKVAGIARRIQKYLHDKNPEVLTPAIDMSKIKGLAKAHYFEKRKSLKAKLELKQQALKNLWQEVSKAIQPVLRVAGLYQEPFHLESMPKHLKNTFFQFIHKAPSYLSQLFEHCYNNASAHTKTYSFHRDAVSRFNKNKHDKGIEFGRQFQIGRIGGNFLYSMPNDNLRMPDARSLKGMLIEHIHIFQTPIDSIATDKGYYSKDNEQLALDFKIKKIGIQRPNRKLRNAPIIDYEQTLENRRAGIEPLISHLKRSWQMGRSRMKSDKTTESSGYCAILGFNLRQMVRYLTGEAVLT